MERAAAFPNPEIPSFDEQGLMRPPWQKFPNIPHGSIGWRMGAGESYSDDFREWLESQPESIKSLMREKYPLPDGWTGFY
jgi:hypothetical protein